MQTNESKIVRITFKAESPKVSSGAMGSILKTGNKALFCGGDTLGKGCLILNGGSNGNWVDGPDMNFKRAYAGMSAVRDGLLVTGGFGDTIEDTIEYYDGQNWRLLKSDLDDGLFGHCQVSIDANTTFIIGGRSLTSGITDKTWFITILSLKEGQEVVEFNEGPKLLDARHNLACVYDAETKAVLVVGGSENEITTEILDLESPNLEWKQGPDLPNNSPLENAQLIINPDYGTLLIGGNNPTTDSAKSAPWKLVDLEQWQYVPQLQLQTPRTAFVAFNIPSSFLKC